MLFQNVLWVLSLSSLVVGQDASVQDPNNHWVSLPGLPHAKVEDDASVIHGNETVWQNGTQQHLVWVATCPVKIYCNQQGPNASQRVLVYTDNSSNMSANSTWWTVSIPLSLFLDGSLNVFLFEVYNLSAPTNKPNAPIFLSHYFNVTQPSTPSPPSSSSSSSNAVAIGAGVGGGVGGALLLAAIAYGLYYMRKRKQREQQQQQQQTNAEAGIVPELPSPTPNEKYGVHVDHAGQYVPINNDTYFGNSPVGSPAPAYKTGFEHSQELGHDNPHEAAHELDSTANRH